MHFTERGVVIDDPQTFFTHRRKISQKEYTVCVDCEIEDIQNKENRQKGDFRLFTNNCEHFTRWFLNEYTDAKRAYKISPQVCIFLAGTAVLVYKAFKKRK